MAIKPWHDLNGSKTQKDPRAYLGHQASIVVILRKTGPYTLTDTKNGNTEISLSFVKYFILFSVFFLQDGYPSKLMYW